MAKPTLYYHFQSKEGLAQVLLTVPLTSLVDTLKRVVKTVEDPVSCLEQVIELATSRFATTRIAADSFTLCFSGHRARTWSASSSRSATAF